MRKELRIDTPAAHGPDLQLRLSRYRARLASEGRSRALAEIDRAIEQARLREEDGE